LRIHSTFNAVVKQLGLAASLSSQATN